MLLAAQKSQAIIRRGSGGQQTTDEKWPSRLAYEGLVQLFTRQGCWGGAGVSSLALCRPPSPGRSCWEEGAAVLSSPCSAASASLSSLRERLRFVPWRGPKNSQISKPGKPAAQKIVHPDSMFFRLTEAFINEVTTPIFTVCGRGTTWGDGGGSPPRPSRPA